MTYTVGRPGRGGA